MIRKLADQYHADHPKITIELDSLNTDQQKLKLKTQAASKEVPDITVVNPAAQMQPFVDADLFEPLNDMVTKNGLKDTFQAGLLDFYTFNGNLYALPDGNNLAVNPPATYEELVAHDRNRRDAGESAANAHKLRVPGIRALLQRRREGDRGRAAIHRRPFCHGAVAGESGILRVFEPGVLQPAVQAKNRRRLQGFPHTASPRPRDEAAARFGVEGRRHLRTRRVP
jgi:hypothetical protein